MSWMKRHPLVAYFILVYAITWVLVLPLVVSVQGLLDIQISPIWHFLEAFGTILAAAIIVLKARSADLSRSGKQIVPTQ